MQDPDTNKKLWFRARNYGWGWTPISWQGCLTVLIYIVCIIFFVPDLHRVSVSTADLFLNCILPILGVTIIFLYVVHRKGETPRWKWGSYDSLDK